MQVSTLPILVLVIFGLAWYQTTRLYRLGSLKRSERNWLSLVLAALLIWGFYVGYQSSRGVFGTADFISLMPGYWLPLVPVVVVSFMLLLAPALRRALRTLVDETPHYWLSGIHMLRILAIGSLIKASMGEFPEKFAWFVGGPDLLFGLSAVVVTIMLRQRWLDERFMLPWNLLGSLVILLPVFGLMHLFMQETLFRELFAYPMVLAPALVVPTMVMVNLMVAGRLLEKRISGPGGI